MHTCMGSTRCTVPNRPKDTVPTEQMSCEMGRGSDSGGQECSEEDVSLFVLPDPALSIIWAALPPAGKLIYQSIEETCSSCGPTNI